MNEKIKVVAFDVEGTLIENTLWGRMHPLFGVSYEQDHEWYKQYKCGALSFRDWIDTISRAWVKNPVKRADVEEVLKDFDWTPHVFETVAVLKERGYELAVISSGIDVFVKEVARQLSIPHFYYFNFFEFTQDDYFQKIGFVSGNTELEEKVHALKSLESKFNVAPEQIAYIGDSRNDLRAFQHTQRGILYGEGNEDLCKAAWKQITSIDEVLDLVP